MTTTQAGFTRYTGSRVHRVEDDRLLRGRGTFVDDVERPRHAPRLLRAQPRRPRAGSSSIDVAEARALPGVHAVFLAEDLNPGVHEQWHSQLGPDGPETPRPPLAEDEVRFVGDPVALVVADDRYVAEDACELVVVDYDPLPAGRRLRGRRRCRRARPRGVRQQRHPRRRRSGVAMLDAVFSAAAHVVEESVHQQAYAAVPIETRGIVVEHEPGVGEITMWVATQAPHEHRAFCARLLGIPEHRVRAIARDTGGGFGQKIFVQREEMAVMLAATKLPVALKWIEDRRENLMAAGLVPPRARRRPHGVRRRRRDPGRPPRLRVRRRRLPDAVAGDAGDDGRHRLPRPVPGARGRLPAALGVHQHGRALRLPGARGSTRRSPARSCSTSRRAGWASTPSSCAAGTCCALDEMPYKNPNGMRYDYV